MRRLPTAAEKLAAKIAGIGTAQLIELHGKTLDLYYAVPLADAEPHRIVVEAIAAKLVKRGVEMTSCCYCPVPHHDVRICDATAPNPLTEAADLIMEGIARVHRA